MLTIDDFYTDNPLNEDLLDGIVYAGRSINFTFDRMKYGNQTYNRLKRIVVGITVQKVLENFLRIRDIPYNTKGRTHWRSTDISEFQIKNQLVDIKGYHVYPDKSRFFPNWFLDIDGLVPSDQINKKYGPELFIQAFLISPQTNNSNQHYYIAPFPKQWSNRWREARCVHLTYRGNIEVSLFGESDDGIGKSSIQNYDISENFVLFSDKIITSNVSFSSLEFVSSCRRPQKEFEVQIDNNGSYIIKPGDWYDLWLDNPTVVIAAWGSKADYLSGEVIQPGTCTDLYTGGTRTKNYAKKIRDLNSIEELIHG